MPLLDPTRRAEHPDPRPGAVGRPSPPGRPAPAPAPAPSRTPGPADRRLSRLREVWPLAWAAVCLLGWTAGEWWAGRSPEPTQPRRPPSEWLLRLPSLTPLVLLAGTAPAAQAAAWAATAGGCAWAGRAEARARRSRPDAAAPDRWSPSRRLAWRAGAALRVTGWARERPGGWEAPAVLVALGDSLETMGGAPPLPGDGVLLRGEGRAPAPGRLVAGLLTAGSPERAATRGGFDRARFLAGRGLLWRGSLEAAAAPPAAHAGHGGPLAAAGAALGRLRAALLRGIAAGLPPREAGLIAGVLLGWRDEALGATREPFAELGLAHLFAVSGLHVGILLGVLATLLVPLRPGPGLRLAAASLPLLLYAALTGLSASVLRAAGLAAVALAAPVCGRRADGLRVLGLLFWLNATAAPWGVLDSGCRLSYLAAAGIVTVHRLVCPPSRWPAPLRWAVAGLLVTTAAQWFTLPEVMTSFGWLHPLSPLANLAAVPLFGICVWLAVLGLGTLALPGGIGLSLLAACWLLLRLLQSGTVLAGGVGAGPVGAEPPGPLRLAALLALGAVLLATLAARRRGAVRRRGAAAAIVLTCAGAMAGLLPAGRSAPPGEMSAAQFAVGQGDCAVLVFPDRACIVIDTGPGGGPAGHGGGPCAMGLAVRPWLRRQGVSRIAGVVLSHGHDDHTGGAADLANALPVDRWWVSGNADAPGEGEIRLAGGETLHACGPWELLCLQAGPAGPTGKGTPGENDRSCAVALLRRGTLLALWPGDLEREGEGPLLAALSRRGRTGGGGLQVLKAGHHGSVTSSGPDLLRELRPGLVVLSCGVANRHRHPSHGPFLAGADTLESVRTDLEGTVLLRWDAAGAVSWRTARGRQGKLPPPVGASPAARAVAGPA